MSHLGLFVPRCNYFPRPTREPLLRSGWCQTTICVGLRNAQLWNPDLCLEVQNRSFHIKDNQCLPPNDSLTLRFESGKPVPDSTFWVVEMIPGVSEMRVTRPSKGV